MFSVPWLNRIVPADALFPKKLFANPSYVYNNYEIQFWFHLN